MSEQPTENERAWRAHYACMREAVFVGLVKTGAIKRAHWLAFTKGWEAATFCALTAIAPINQLTTTFHNAKGEVVGE